MTRLPVGQRRRLLVAWAAVSLCTGCASIGYKAPAGQNQRPALAALGERFCIRNVDTSWFQSSGAPYKPEIEAVLSALSPGRLNQALDAEYPDCFSAGDGYPLDLTVKMKYDNHYQTRSLGAMFCGFTFGVIPCSLTSDYTFTISHAENKGAVQRVLLNRVQTASVTRRGWFSIIPTGYFPCPAQTDTPQELITGMMEPEMQVTEAGKAFIARQVAFGIARMISDVAPDDIKRAVLFERLKNE